MSEGVSRLVDSIVSHENTQNKTKRNKIKIIIICRRRYSEDNVMSCRPYDHTCNNTLARRRNVIDNVRVNNAFSH